VDNFPACAFSAPTPRQQKSGRFPRRSMVLRMPISF
jgi:hypothetical protein